MLKTIMIIVAVAFAWPAAAEIVIRRAPTPAVPDPPATSGAFPKWRPKSADELPRFVCEWFDNMKLLSQKCEVSHWRQTIDIAGDLTTSDARTACAMVRELKLPLYGWELRIFTPHTVRPIASCEFIDLR
jgi:hypothetical protein